MTKEDVKNDPQSLGGKARAKALSAERRSDIARKAAFERWHKDIPVATHEGTFPIGEVNVAAAVLPDETRLLTQATFLRAIGRSRSPKKGTGVLSTVDGTPFFLQAEALKPFISNELTMSTAPVFYRTGSGKKGVGYDAKILPKVAEVYLRFRDACHDKGEDVPRQYKHIVRACDSLIRGLAEVGIVALVDEATGYQEVRDRQALQAILDTYLKKEFAAWAKRFPDEFYREIFRLRGWEWMGMKKNRPQLVGKFTNSLVYDRLAPGIKNELQRRNPRNERGYREVKHHQWLTENVGHPKLAEHLYGIVGLMRAHDNGDWRGFMKSLERAYPKRGPNLDIFIDDSS